VSDSLTRRKLITTGLAAAAGSSALGVAAALASRYGLIPPNHQGIFGPSETLTYAAQRVLIPRHSLAREFNRSEISKIAPVNGEPPKDETYQRLSASGFAGWRLTVDGLVARPSSFSLEELKRFPSRSQITNHVCEQGWSFIAEWIGVPVSHILNVVGALPGARYVVAIPYENYDPPQSWWESIDMVDAWHPQTLLAYGMNGPELPIRHGAPVRLKLPRQLGYKSVKYLHRITVTDTVKNIGKGVGGANVEDGYSWYAGI
jgi:DMSO/TMAO reductase YedYZ molybdopterin-dependent catalytic subunit